MLSKAIRNAPLLLPIVAIVYGYSARHMDSPPTALSTVTGEEAEFRLMARPIGPYQEPRKLSARSAGMLVTLIREDMMQSRRRPAKFYEVAAEILRYSARADDQRLADEAAKLAHEGRKIDPRIAKANEDEFGVAQAKDPS